jgi:hypothetical protein
MHAFVESPAVCDHESTLVVRGARKAARPARATNEREGEWSSMVVGCREGVSRV